MKENKTKQITAATYKITFTVNLTYTIAPCFSISGHPSFSTLVSFAVMQIPHQHLALIDQVSLASSLWTQSRGERDSQPAPKPWPLVRGWAPAQPLCEGAAMLWSSAGWHRRPCPTESLSCPNPVLPLHTPVPKTYTRCIRPIAFLNTPAGQAMD